MYAIRKARSAAALDADRELQAYFDPQFDTYAVKVLPGEYLVTERDVMLVTLLGSCVSACVHDPVTGVGGMNHFMLPESDAGGGVGESARYGAYAMEMLINDLIKRGATRERLEAKVFGGGAVLAGMTHTNIGDRNGRFALQYLADEGIAVVAQDLYDVYPRRVHYFPHSGRAMVRRLPPVSAREVAERESLYRSRLRESPTTGSVELF